MTSICIKCGEQMPKDRKGWEQICPKCLEKNEVLNFKELMKPTEDFIDNHISIQTKMAIICTIGFIIYMIFILMVLK